MNRRGAVFILFVTLGCGPKLEVRDDAQVSDLPLAGISQELRAAFDEGDALFDLTLREADGLGPLAIRPSCGACHAAAGRGPGFAERMAQVGSDGVTPVPGQPELPWGSVVRRLTVGGAKPIEVPASTDVKVSTRLGMPVMGLGYLEAVADSTLEALEASQAQRTDGISGRVNRVTWVSEAHETPFHAHRPGDVVIGRFGLKARQATLDDFAADALQGDMGITSPMRPSEPRNPDGLVDDLKPGLDVTQAEVDSLAMYVRLIAIPRRATPNVMGREAFHEAACDVCHVPELPTRADWPIAALAGQQAPVFTDLLLHDLGPAFGDGLTDGTASSTEWRTAPLIGQRFLKHWLHDGRADSVAQAIELHGGAGSEARMSVEAWRALSPERSRALVEYVSSL